LTRWTKCIEFLNDLFYGRSHIAAPAELSISFLLNEKPTVVPNRLGQRVVGKRAKGSLSRRSHEVRARGVVGLRWQAVLIAQIVWNKSTRRAGARGGARVPKSKSCAGHHGLAERRRCTRVGRLSRRRAQRQPTLALYPVVQVRRVAHGFPFQSCLLIRIPSYPAMFTSHTPSAWLSRFVFREGARSLFQG
jgi:hypothetical protein